MDEQETAANPAMHRRYASVASFRDT